MKPLLGSLLYFFKHVPVVMIIANLSAVCVAHLFVALDIVEALTFPLESHLVEDLSLGSAVDVESAGSSQHVRMKS